MKNVIGLNPVKIKSIGITLNNILANEFILYGKTLNHHWNVIGKHFGALHKLFNDQYEEILDIIDDLAERIRSIDMHVHATLTEFLHNGTIKEFPNIFDHDLAMIRDLIDAHEIIICQLRPAIKETQAAEDMGTNNFLSDLIEKHEKMAWMLRAHVEK